MASPASEPSSRSSRLHELLDKTDYRAVVSDEDREAVFRLRYDAYRREQLVETDFSRRLSDRYDDLDNTTVYGVFIEGELASTVRVHVATADLPDFPSMAAFGDVLADKLAAGCVIVEGSRIAANIAFSRRYPDLMPFVTLRINWMAALYYGADYYLGAVRTEHRAFYRRVFQGRVICEPRPYNGLPTPLCLMSCDVVAERERVQQRYPVLQSSLFERRMLFNYGSSPAASHDGELVPITTSVPGVAAELPQPGLVAVRERRS